MVAAPGLGVPAAAAASVAPRHVSVIVLEADPASSAAERVVADLDGRVTRRLDLMGGFAARVPAGRRAILDRSPSVKQVWSDGRVHMSEESETDGGDAEELWEYDELPPETAWPDAIRLAGARGVASGSGVTVAVLDTGATRHPDLGNRMARRVDVTPDADGYDRFGHGTHMTGIVAGDGRESEGKHSGVAPAARIVSVKVAGFDGATDVSAVLAAFEWIAAHREQYGIRVLNLSFGTDATQGHLADPLNFGVQRLWRSGILVVAAAGNHGGGGGRIDKPGDDPFVLTVGAADVRGTPSTSDDRVAPFSSHGPTGDGVAKPDLVAPGISIVSHRASGSTADRTRPAARLEEDDYFKGTGTSQASAVVSGVAALMFSARPSLTPDEAKAALVGTADTALRGEAGAGAGLVDAAAATIAARDASFRGRPANGGLTASSGLGSLDASRGSFKPYADVNGDGAPELLSGEVDALGRRWDAGSWTAREWSASNWPDSPWARVTTGADGWSEAPAPSASWYGLSVAGNTWRIRRWSELPSGFDPWVVRRWSIGVWEGN
jgi:serine protease AprX